MNEVHATNRHHHGFPRFSEVWWARALLLAGLLLSVSGCPHPGVGQQPPPEPPPPPEVQQANFQEIVRAVEQAAEDGWEERECRRIARSFVELSERSHGLPEALFNAGMVLRGCELHEDAMQLLEQANEAARRRTKNEAPGFAPSLIVLGSDAVKRGDRVRAKQLFDKALAANPPSADGYTNVATLQREDGNWVEAQRNLRRALAVDSEHMAAYLQMALLYLDLADENADMLDITTLVCQQAVTRGAEADVAPEKTAPIHNVWGLAYYRKGDIVAAVSQFDKARLLDPGLFEAHLNFGSINLSFRGYEAAERAFRKAIVLRPESYEANLSLGVALRGQQRYDEARDAYEKALQIDGDRPGAHYNLGVLAQDYLFGETAEHGGQMSLLESAKQSYRRFVAACDASPEMCVRRRFEEPEEDLREAARRRIDACDAIASALDGQ